MQQVRKIVFNPVARRTAIKLILKRGYKERDVELLKEHLISMNVGQLPALSTLTHWIEKVRKGDWGERYLKNNKDSRDTTSTLTGKQKSSEGEVDKYFTTKMIECLIQNDEFMDALATKVAENLEVRRKQ